MIQLFEKIGYYFSFPFVRYALIVGVLVALCASILGVILVLKRFSFIGDGLSHVAFGATAVAAVVGLTNHLWVVLPVTVLCAIILFGCGERMRVKGDASIAMLSVGAIAVGYLLLNRFAPTAKVSEHLFGSTSILTLTAADVWLCVGLTVVIIAIFFLFYHKIFSVTFDESFARATGIRTKMYHLMLAVVIAVIIVLAMRLVGSLLISALIIFPAMSAMRLFKSFRGVMICSAALAVIGATLGILTSLIANTPVGATIVAVDIVIFSISWVIGAAFHR